MMRDLGIPEACAGALIRAQASIAGGLGAARHPAGSARGRARSHLAATQLTSGEREGQSPLASSSNQRQLPQDHHAMEAHQRAAGIQLEAV